MHESSVSPPPAFFLPLWARIAMASFMSAVAVPMMWKRFLQFDWVVILCLGLHYVLYVPRQKGEAAGAYVRKPRNIISFALLMTALAGSLRAIYSAFMK